MLVRVAGVCFWVVSKCLVFGCVSVFGKSLETGAREQGLGRGCAYVLLLVAGFLFGVVSQFFV